MFPQVAVLVHFAPPEANSKTHSGACALFETALIEEDVQSGFHGLIHAKL